MPHRIDRFPSTVTAEIAPLTLLRDPANIPRGGIAGPVRDRLAEGPYPGLEPTSPKWTAFEVMQASGEGEDTIAAIGERTR